MNTKGAKIRQYRVNAFVKLTDMLDLSRKIGHFEFMNKLTSEDRARILHLLCEGQSIRAITRLTGASKNTVAKLLIDAGKACRLSRRQCAEREGQAHSGR